MFSENELRLATITNPFFKLSWLDNEDDVRRAKTLLRGEFVRFQGLNNESESSDDSSDGTSFSISDPSPEKKQRRAKDLCASITKRNEKSKVIDKVETFLKMCGNLDDLPNYPTIMKMYKRYNVTLPSSAAVERLFSQAGLIFTAKRYQLTDKHFEMLLFLKINNQMLNNW
ncbi:uncharacterized protein LOC132088593 [Daphnia carinata]|uniref:uncharacterized protein LOC132088593 n=1 Tax=Daphnia carinata TaxID=120202 RepID=UPI002868E2B3|nr:uncharacterized protein LOC132088593 [Daphnia carinata]